MKPDYKNWIPKVMLYSLIAGTLLSLVLLLILLYYRQQRTTLNSISASSVMHGSGSKAILHDSLAYGCTNFTVVKHNRKREIF